MSHSGLLFPDRLSLEFAIPFSNESIALAIDSQADNPTTHSRQPLTLNLPTSRSVPRHQMLFPNDDPAPRSMALILFLPWVPLRFTHGYYNTRPSAFFPFSCCPASPEAGLESPLLVICNPDQKSLEFTIPSTLPTSHLQLPTSLRQRDNSVADNATTRQHAADNFSPATRQQLQQTSRSRQPDNPSNFPPPASNVPPKT